MATIYAPEKAVLTTPWTAETAPKQQYSRSHAGCISFVRLQLSTTRPSVHPPTPLQPRAQHGPHFPTDRHIDRYRRRGTLDGPRSKTQVEAHQHQFVLWPHVSSQYRPLHRALLQIDLACIPCEPQSSVGALNIARPETKRETFPTNIGQFAKVRLNQEWANKRAGHIENGDIVRGGRAHE